MRVEIDPVKCGTIGVCVKECPSWFQFEAGSKKAITPEGEVPAHLEDKVRETAYKCPNRAISIIE